MKPVFWLAHGMLVNYYDDLYDEVRRNKKKLELFLVRFFAHALHYQCIIPFTYKYNNISMQRMLMEASTRFNSNNAERCLWTLEMSAQTFDNVQESRAREKTMHRKVGVNDPSQTNIRMDNGGILRTFSRLFFIPIVSFFFSWFWFLFSFVISLR